MIALHPTLCRIAEATGNRQNPDKPQHHIFNWPGWGYTVHWQQVRSRDFGNNLQPARITIDTRDDLLRLAGRESEYAATRKVTQRVREELPALSDWLTNHIRSISGLADSIEGLIAVTNYFVQNPWPDCYVRQLPVSVDTKFIERHQSILRQWLDILLPASAIDVNETKFVRRFGLRDADRHRGVRVLDQVLLHEFGLPFEELSLPLRSLATLRVRHTTIIIVENKLNLFTLPTARRSLGLLGEGKAVTRLELRQRCSRRTGRPKWADAGELAENAFGINQN